MSFLRRFPKLHASLRRFRGPVTRALAPLLIVGLAARESWTALRTQAGREKRRAAVLAADQPRKKIMLFLAPEAGLEPFYASHALLARTLNDAGHTAILLSCNGLQPTCSLKFARQVNLTRPNDHWNIQCIKCRTIAMRTGHDYSFTDLSLEQILSPAQRAEIARITADYAAEPWRASYDGIEIGAACLGETLRAQRKVSVEQLEAADKALISGLLYSSLAIYMATKELSSRFDIQRISYFGDYAFFIAPQILARKLNIPLTNVSHAYNRDIDRRYLNLRPGHGYSHMMSQINQWDDYRDIPITPQIIANIADGSLYRLVGHGGASTYSPNWVKGSEDLVSELGLPPGGKLLVAYSNSTDELMCNHQILRVLGIPYAGGRNPFDNQIAWLKTLVDWVGARPDLRLVVRLHPRMAVSHRHSSVASELSELKRVLAQMPRNAAVVWPESEMSSYNIAEYADVALTAWSSIGLELSRFGVPVIAAFQKVGPFPNSKFSVFEETEAAYFAAIEDALAQPMNLDTIVEAFRWTHFLHWAPLIDTSDVVPEPDYPSVPAYRKPENNDTILKVFAQDEDLVALNMRKLPRGGAAAPAEMQAVRATLAKFMAYFLSGNPDFIGPDFEIRLPEDNAPINAATRPLLRVEADDLVVFEKSGHRTRRRSPLVARLARTLAAPPQPKNT